MLPIERKLPRVIVDAEWRLRRVNPSYAALVGFSSEQLVGRPAVGLVARPDLARSGERITVLMGEGFIPSLVWHSIVRHADGSELEIAGVARQIYDDEGRLVKSIQCIVPWDRRHLLLDALEPVRDARDQLSAREQEVVQLLERGLHPKDIARELRLSVHTVRNHLRFVYRKLGVRSQLELIARLRSGT